MAQARAKIGADDARRLILARLLRTLHDGYDAYLRRHRRDFVAAVENLWDKYAVTARDILAGAGSRRGGAGGVPGGVGV